MGRYLCERLLGEGGMGVVLLASDELLGRHVALKVIRPELANDPVCRERLLREARAAAKLKSPHTARVLDVAAPNSDTPFVVYEYLEGADLRTVLEERGPLRIPIAVTFLLHACDALAEAHSHGIVHRDLKPENFFCAVLADGTPSIKLLDFGISKVVGLDDSFALTRPDALVGSPAYMAPEQLRRVADSRSDIWALGAVLYELVTGSPAFDGECVADVWAAILSQDARPASQLRSDLPAEVEAVIERCLRRDPDQRFQSVGDLARELAPFASAAEASNESGLRRSVRATRGDRKPGRRTVTTSSTSMSWRSSGSPRSARRPLSWLLAMPLQHRLVLGGLLGGLALGGAVAVIGNGESSPANEPVRLPARSPAAPANEPVSPRSAAPANEPATPAPVVQSLQKPQTAKRKLVRQAPRAHAQVPDDRLPLRDVTELDPYDPASFGGRR